MNKVSVEQIRRIQRFSVVARGCCTVIAITAVAISVWLASIILRDTVGDDHRISIGTFVLNGADLHGAAIKTWLMIALAAANVISLGMIYLLRGVFTNLARGEIFSAANVQRIHNIGVLILWIGVWQFVVPLVSTMVLSDPTHTRRHYSFWLTPFAVGALIILVSWIMNVGLGVSKEAEELKREADLVV